MSGDELEYRCTRCGTLRAGANNVAFVAGLLNGVFCSVRCLVAVGEAHLESVERAMAHIDYGVSG